MLLLLRSVCPSVCHCLTSLLVCLSVCLSASISLEPLDRSALNFVYGSPVAVVQSSFGAVALHYILRVCGRRRTWPQWVLSQKVEADPLRDCHERHGDTGAESDVYECLLNLDVVRCRVARRRTCVRSSSVLRVCETTMDRVRHQQPSDQLQLSASVSPTHLRLRHQPSNNIRLPYYVRQRRLQNQPITRCYKIRFLRDSGSVRMTSFAIVRIFIDQQCVQLYNTFTARAYARAVLGVVILSVRLSVCVSHAWIVTKLNDALQIF